ncbi:ABC transporter ATP-binding protein [Moorella sp. Hama-1]|uniref:ABC transporter ATP-binding protein n=1 Tax=Moorella sp. Hama-1 TaxID=2138101 RepID=UPI000D644133|nr:sn-glycerol-3-phosphate ABC transporter ATP-binding protein UgpC [Moorella sp. Hama-1]BCV22471.1 ABC transporter ATP-binding protein [Moorella sp. Hama-1]
MAGVLLEEVVKRFGELTVVKGINLEIKDGEFLVLVGPSGCGKSTTLRMIAGLEDISEGNIYIGEKRVNDLPPKDRDIAMVFQNYALYPHMNVYDNMSFGLRLRKLPREEIKRRVEEAANMLGISHLLQRKPRELSGGQRQRVALGRAIVREPQAFLMDEPLSNLDAKLRVQMRVELEKLHSRLKTTIIYVTHDQVEAMTLGERIVIMNEGLIQQVGTPEEVYNSPANMFVAGFIGSPPMNFIGGRLLREKEKLFFANQGLNINLSEIDFKRINEIKNEDVVLGIRPEDILISENEKEGGMAARVELVESVGSESYIYLDQNGFGITVRAGRNIKFRRGENVKLYFNPTTIHLFDRTSGQAFI